MPSPTETNNDLPADRSRKRLNDLKPGIDYVDPKHALLKGVPDEIGKLEFLKACERLGIPLAKWPDFGTVLLPGGPAALPGASPAPQKSMGIASVPLKFELPAFDLCADDHRTWRRKADRAWKTFQHEHFGPYLKKCVTTRNSLTRIGMLTPRKRPRLSGVKRNAIPLDRRYEFAALRYCLRDGWSTLQSMYDGVYSVEQIRKSVTIVLATLGLDHGR